MISTWLLAVELLLLLLSFCNVKLRHRMTIHVQHNNKTDIKARGLSNKKKSNSQSKGQGTSRQRQWPWPKSCSNTVDWQDFSLNNVHELFIYCQARMWRRSERAEVMLDFSTISAGREGECPESWLYLLFLQKLASLHYNPKVLDPAPGISSDSVFISETPRHQSSYHLTYIYYTSFNQEKSNR